MKYNLEDKPKLAALILYGLQWWVVALPSIVILGLVVSKLHLGGDAGAQALYMQKLFFISGVTLLVQIRFGHKLPIVVGPASVLLIGVLASASGSVSAIYTAIAIGGLLITLIAASGLLRYAQKVFTPRVIIVTILLMHVEIDNPPLGNPHRHTDVLFLQRMAYTDRRSRCNDFSQCPYILVHHSRIRFGSDTFFSVLRAGADNQ